MKIATDNLGQQLEKTRLPLYWIAGDEPLLVQEAGDVIRRYAKKNGFDNKIIFNVDNKFDWQAFVAETQSLSLFSDKTLIELRTGSKVLPEQGRKILADYLQNPAEDKLILIISGKIDSKSQSAKWFLAIEQYSAFVAIWPLSPVELARWLEEKLQHHGLRVDREVKQLLLARGEGNLLAISQDLEKLSLLYGSSVIESVKAQEVISDNSRYDIFSLVDAALEGHGERVIKILNALRQEGTETILVLWAIAREIRMLATLQESANPGPVDFRKHGVFQKRIPLVQKALRKKNMHYGDLLQHCADLDSMIKGAMQGNVWDTLQRTALQLAGIQI